MFEVKLQIDRPPRVVFAHLADVESAPRWYEAVRRVDNPSGRSVERGTHVTFHRRIAGRDLTNDVELNEFRPDACICFTTRDGPTPFTYRYDLQPVGGGTELTLKGEISGEGLPGPLALLGPLVERSFARGMRINLEALKRWIECA